jgi:hypothetical protein
MSVKRPKKGTNLWRLGVWATIWWGVSCLYLLLVVWLAKDYYTSNFDKVGSSSIFNGWITSISNVYNESSYLPCILLIIISVWVIGGAIWLQELKKAKISYKAAFKDMFLTIRK